MVDAGEATGLGHAGHGAEPALDSRKRSERRRSGLARGTDCATDRPRADDPPGPLPNRFVTSVPPRAEALRLLIADRRGWIARALANVLASDEWDVTHAHSGTELRELIPRIRPHAILLHDDLSDVAVPTLCAELRRDPAVGVLTPVLAVSTHPLREPRLDALRAGATDYSIFPPDSEPFLLQLRALALARREAERLEHAALLDVQTGLYTVAGLAHRAQEIANEASRRHDPLTCVAFGPRSADAPRQLDPVLDDAIARARRRSDAVGRRRDVLVAIAPATGGPGAQRMAERLHQVLEQRDVRDAAGGEPRFRAAYCTVADFARSSLDVAQMLDRAIASLAPAEPATADTPAIVGEAIPLVHEPR
jgi:DNA-binding response OmpR family regulator